MPNFELEKIETIKDGDLFVRKLFRNDRCYYDDFCDKIENGRLRQFNSEFLSILSKIQIIATDGLKWALNFKWINKIKSGKKIIAYEIRTKHLRLYFIEKEPGIIIILGGLKKSQEKDINQLKKIIDQYDSSLKK